MTEKAKRMGNGNLSPELLEILEKLNDKYEADGQDLVAYLKGMFHSEYLTYWDYIHLDTLLNLQTPRTNFPDETTFIVYHQISELYFKLILHEQDKIIFGKPDREVFLRGIKRMNACFDHLIDSFSMMLEGLDKEEFLQFRLALLPASGFQSAQYRMIEIGATDFNLLVAPDVRNTLKSIDDVETVYQHIYWKNGATEIETGRKTLTLTQFEEKYAQQFLERAHATKTKNLRQLYLKHHQNDEEIELELRQFDHKANVLWPLTHFKTAAKYLRKDEGEIPATGGTNWQKYLPPRRQQIIFYPQLFKKHELSSWGKKEVL